MRAPPAGAAATARWRVWLGPAIWAAHFLAIYGFTALACARHFASATWAGIGVVSWFIGIATLLAGAVLLAVIGPAVRAGRRLRERAASGAFLHWLRAALAGLALLAVLWQALPVVLVPVCG